MRPVNLIPEEERPGGHKPLRSGPLAYIVVGALAAAVVAITALVVTNSKVADRKAEVAHLQSEQASVQARARALSSYTQFQNVREQRIATVTDLANSRFDWERVLAELSLVMPADVQLTSLTGSAAPGSNSAGGEGIGMRAEIAGPALELVGCAPSQAAVADFIEAVKDIDGVTRVGVPSSTVGGSGEAGGSESAGSCGNESSAQFQMVAGFDAAPAPAPETEGEATTEAAPESEATAEESSSGEGSGESSEESTAD
jgi:Tfp pilus assembly protein PilN